MVACQWNCEKKNDKSVTHDPLSDINLGKTAAGCAPPHGAKQENECSYQVISNGTSGAGRGWIPRGGLES